MVHHSSSLGLALLLFWLGLVVVPVRSEDANSTTTVLFAAHMITSTEVNQMLLIADKLQERGHVVPHFVVNSAYAARVEGHGHIVAGTTPDIETEQWETLVPIFQRATASPDWKDYVDNFFPALINMVSDYYEPCVQAMEDYRTKYGSPDVFYASMFTGCGIDFAAQYDIPLAIHYAANLANIAGYEDHVAAPDTMIGTSIEQHKSFAMRWRKIAALIRFIPKTLAAAAKTAKVRESFGYAPVRHYLDHWKRAAIIHTLPLGFDVARPLRPMTFHVGFVTRDPLNMEDLSAEQDIALKTVLDEYSGGVVFAAFGTLAIPRQEWFDELVASCDEWVKHQAKTTGSTAKAIIALNPKLAEATTLDLSKVPTDTVDVQVSWVNQPLILAHPNTKVFVTHGGQGSISEAVTYQVPMMALPFFGNQPANSFRLEENGTGEKIFFREEPIVRSTISSKLQKLTDNAAYYKKNLLRHHKLSRRAGGASKAADIVEDLIAFGHLDHLIPVHERSDMPFFATNNYDIYFVIFLGLAMTFHVVTKIVLTILSLLSKKPDGRKEKQT